MTSFFHKVASQYLNINKKTTDEFLRNQANYNLAKTPHISMHKPISVQAPNQRWQIDIIDMRFYKGPINKGHEYILTLVDTFSGKVWLRGLGNRLAETIVNNLDSICKEAGTTPHILQGDGEFTSDLFKEWCLNQKPRVILINGNPFSSQSTGKVERANQEVRRRTRAGFIAHNNFRWYDYLDDYAENINNTQSARFGRTPNQLWDNKPYVRPPSKIPEAIEPHDKMSPLQLLEQQRALLNERNNKLLTSDRLEYKYKKGDFVRLNSASGVPTACSGRSAAL
jgi:transposase InsO family protein